MKLLTLNVIVTLHSHTPSSCHTCTLYIKQKAGIKTININILFITKRHQKCFVTCKQNLQPAPQTSR